MTEVFQMFWNFVILVTPKILVNFQHIVIDSQQRE